MFVHSFCIEFCPELFVKLSRKDYTMVQKQNQKFLKFCWFKMPKFLLKIVRISMASMSSAYLQYYPVDKTNEKTTIACRRFVFFSFVQSTDWKAKSQNPSKYIKCSIMDRFKRISNTFHQIVNVLLDIFGQNSQLKKKIENFKHFSKSTNHVHKKQLTINDPLIKNSQERK